LNCSNEPTRVFNNNDLQDPNCYGTFGSRSGYCDMPRRAK